MATKHRPGASEGDSGVATETKKKEQLKKPPLFKVLFHNDNYTTMEFVVWILQSIFHKSEADSVTIMWNVHRKGVGVAGVYTHDVAQTKVDKVHRLARAYEYPLKLSMEPEDALKPWHRRPLRTKELKAAFQHALELATEMRHEYVTLEHLLLAFLRDAWARRRR
jgi:ATP-dependent Clp protease adaptor protein ClpS